MAVIYLSVSCIDQNSISPLSLQVQRLSQKLNELLHECGEEEIPAEKIVEQFMTDTVRADKEKLPNTGCDPEWELMTSSIFFDFDTPLVSSKISILVFTSKNM